jgi:phage tail sheath protein FI
MAITPTYPGVYVQEIPSGVRTITGVATSITAFVGRAQRGPVNEAITINSYGDFERIFGGLWADSTLGYAVRDFYLNGGSQAIIVRLVNAGAKASLAVDSLIVEAANEGTWGNHLRARVQYLDEHIATDVAKRYAGVTKDDLFNLIVRDTKSGVTEQFSNVTVTSGPRQVDKVLKNESTLVRVSATLPGTRPAESGNSPAAGKSVWEDDLTSSKVTTDVTDGSNLTATDFTGTGKEGAKEGLYALEKADLFNLLCIPPFAADGDIDTTLMEKAATYCQKRRAMLIIDPPVGWTSKSSAKSGISSITSSKNAAIFFPRLRQPNPLRDNQLEDFAPCGAVAGVFARTDTQRAIWKAPAGLDATLAGVPQLSVSLTDAENGELNPLAINCLRALPAAGRVVWGARTRQGDDRLASEWKYIPIRRLALYIEESLYRGTQWVVFEPNDEPLWAQIRLNLGAFMHNLFRQGAFQGRSSKEAYFVKCDKETTTQNDRNLGIVNIVVGFAPLKPAEFVIISLQQMAGQV